MQQATDAALTDAERAANFETMRHIERVRNLLNHVIVELLRRGERHDQTKLAPPEVAAFAANTQKLAAMTYGGNNYNATLAQADMERALAHHYAHNRHHPQHHKRGVDDMNLVDLVEMLVDWKAASERHHDGNIKKSIEHNADRFGMSPQLVRVFENTAELLAD